MIECDKCYKLFKYNCFLEKHQTKKISCNKPEIAIKNLTLKIKNLDENITTLENLSIETKKICKYCNNKFKKKYNLICHLNNSCKIKNQLIEEKTKYNDILILKKDELDKQYIYINELKECKKQHKKEIKEIKENLSNGNINAELNNIELRSLGNEDLSHITDEKYKDYIRKLFPGVLNYIKDVHFHPDKPQNHNICIPKIDSQNIAILNKGEWIVGEKEEILKKFINRKISALDSKFYKFEENNELDKIECEAYNDFISSHYKKHIRKKQDREIALLLYNNRKIVDNYKNLIE
jgi:hypothetical protein